MTSDPIARIWCLCFAIVALFLGPDVQAGERWSEAEAQQWYDAQPWLIGANFLPSTAINQLEMWQPETFDPDTIDRELGRAAEIGMNTMRVYLHDIAWQQDAKGFKRRMKTYLSIADRHGIKTMFVFFDGCWDPRPKPGKQPEPILGVHNSGWVQSPGWAVLKDPSSWGRLEEYVNDVISHFAEDRRILAWDVYNEPDCNTKDQAEVIEGINKLLPLSFQWARRANPSQPITAAPYDGPWAPIGKVPFINKVMIENSDIITFHNYDWPEIFEQDVEDLKTYGRPVIASEYMARDLGSTFDLILPIAKRRNIGVINWGLFDGKMQTKFSWDHLPCSYHGIDEVRQNWRAGCEPNIWFTDIFHKDGSPYRQAEIDLIKRLTDLPKGVVE